MSADPLPRLRPLQLGLLSATSILLEITLTRLFAALFYPPYVFAIISLALLGIGLGAAAATWRPGWRHPANLPRVVALAGGLGLALLLVTIWLAPFELSWMLSALVPLPYFFIGIALTTFFSHDAAASPRLYRADLLGAGIGAALAIPMLNQLGAVNGILAVAGLFGLTAWSINAPRYRIIPLFLPLLAGLGLALNLLLPAPWLAVNMARLATAKPITASLTNGGRIIHTEWDAFARTDLVDPGQNKPYEIYLDGAAGSVMPPEGNLNLLQTDIGFFPFATQPPHRVMIIGPGGGLDVWFAQASGAREITAVEINRASVDIVNRFAAYHGDLYGQPEVRLLVDEGRSVLRREARQYDLIYLSQVVTLAAERSGYALTENSVYTVEAFVDYLSHLQPGGQIALKLYDELTLTRAMLTAVTALQQVYNLSEAEAMTRLAVFLDGDAEPPVPLLLVQAEPFSRDDGLAYAGVAAQVGFTPLYVPQVTGSPALQAVEQGQSTLAQLADEASGDVSPTTDDRPFFYQFERGIPQSLRPLLAGLGLALGGGIIVLIRGQRPYPRRGARYAPLYFGALGGGFILLEIVFIQQSRLFLGHPTLAVTTALAVILVGGGLGSGWAGRWPAETQARRLGWILTALIGITLLWLVGWPWLADYFFTQTLELRLLVVSLALLPSALLMGMPFPLGLRLVGRLTNGQRHVALAWAVNSVMTVVGAVLAITLAMQFGFSRTLGVGVALYGVAALFAFYYRQDFTEISLSTDL